MVHGMRSSPNGAFTVKNGDSASLEAQNKLNYDSIWGIDYSWYLHIDHSAQSMATLLNNLFTQQGCPSTSSFDIEAHSEGVVVSFASIKYMTPTVTAKLGNVVSIAGPIDGTPLATDPDLFLTYLMNLAATGGDEVAAGLLLPEDKNDMTFFIGDLATGSPEIQNAQTAAASAVNSYFTAFAGNSPYSVTIGKSWWSVTLNDSFVFFGAPNDGVVPVSSALPTDTKISHLTANQQYPLDHTHLVNNSQVMGDVLTALGLHTSQKGNPIAISASIYPSNVEATVTNVTITGTASPNATVTVKESRPDGTSASFQETANSSGTFVDGPFIPQMAGQYTETFTDTSGDTPYTLYFYASAGSGFTASVNTTGQTISAGQSASFVVTFTSTGGFTGTVTPEALYWQPEIPGATASWSPITVTLPANGTASSTFTINTSASSTTPGTYMGIVLQGVSGSTTKTTGGTVSVIVNSSSSQTKPPTPTGLSPGSSTSPGPSLPTTPMLTWNPSSGATSYEVAVVSTATQAAVCSQITSATNLTCSALPNGTYIWGVTATNSVGSSSPSASLYFTVAAAPVITGVTSPVPSSNSLEPMTITGMNFSTLAQGGSLLFTDTIGNTHSSTTYPSRVGATSSTSWVYNINDAQDTGTWYVQVINANGQASNSYPFKVQ